MDCNRVFRWFVGLNIDDTIWDVTVFTKNRERLMRSEFAERLMLAVVRRRTISNRRSSQLDQNLPKIWTSENDQIVKALLSILYRQCLARSTNRNRLQRIEAKALDSRTLI